MSRVDLPIWVNYVFGRNIIGVLSRSDVSVMSIIESDMDMSIVLNKPPNGGNYWPMSRTFKQAKVL